MDGVFSFLKGPAISSHDAVAICRRLLHEKRIGHSGTLDPLAMGVLPMFVGKATRLIEYTSVWEKTYVAECCLDYGTDTEDVLGETIEETKGLPAPSWEDLAEICARFVGEQEQKPSIYSAIKVNGKRAYELARAGEEVELASRPIVIYELELLAYAYPYFTVRCRCSAGTYIRALLRDLCHGLGRCGTMTQLTRTQVGPFTIEGSVTGEELEGQGDSILLPSDRAIEHLAALELDGEQMRAIQQGKRLSLRGFDVLTGQVYRAYGPQGFIGVVKAEEKALKAEKILYSYE